MGELLNFGRCILSTTLRMKQFPLKDTFTHCLQKKSSVLYSFTSFVIDLLWLDEGCKSQPFRYMWHIYNDLLQKKHPEGLRGSFPHRYKHHWVKGVGKKKHHLYAPFKVIPWQFIINPWPEWSGHFGDWISLHYLFGVTLARRSEVAMNDLKGVFLKHPLKQKGTWHEPRKPMTERQPWHSLAPNPCGISSLGRSS